MRNLFSSLTASSSTHLQVQIEWARLEIYHGVLRHVDTIISIQMFNWHPHDVRCARETNASGMRADKHAQQDNCAWFDWVASIHYAKSASAIVSLRAAFQFHPNVWIKWWWEENVRRLVRLRQWLIAKGAQHLLVRVQMSPRDLGEAYVPLRLA